MAVSRLVTGLDEIGDNVAGIEFDCCHRGPEETQEAEACEGMAQSWWQQALSRDKGNSSVAQSKGEKAAVVET